MPVRIGSAYNHRHYFERGLCQLMLSNDIVERTFIAIMGELHSRKVKRNGIDLIRLLYNLIEWNVDEFGVFVHEALYQPRTCDPVYFRTFTGDPFHRSRQVTTEIF